VEHSASRAYRHGQRAEGFRKAFLNHRLSVLTGEPMENIDQLQLVVAEVQAARQQVSSVRAQIQELEGLHRQLGGVLIEVADRAALINELNETLTSLRTHMERFAEREKQLIETYDELKQSLQGA
jgi:chaperonin cofactor prefoldin